MSVEITINAFDRHSIRNAINKLKTYQADIDGKMQEVCERLAHIGENRARIDFSAATYDGNNDVVVSAEPFESGWRVRASGEATLFIEFGSGAIGYGHPEPQGYGPSTWSLSERGKGHWDDPNGWYYAHGKKSWGNPPAAAMFHAEQDIRAEIENVVREVFGNK